MFSEENNIGINRGEVSSSHVGIKSHCFKQRRAMNGRMDGKAENCLTIVKGSGLVVYKLNTNIYFKKVCT